MLVWRRARTLPTVMLATARSQRSQKMVRFSVSQKPVRATILKMAMRPASLGTKPSRPATGLDAPWYTSAT